MPERARGRQDRLETPGAPSWPHLLLCSSSRERLPLVPHDYVWYWKRRPLVRGDQVTKGDVVQGKLGTLDELPILGAQVLFYLLRKERCLWIDDSVASEHLRGALSSRAGPPILDVAANETANYPFRGSILCI